MLKVDGPKTSHIGEFSAHQHRAAGELERLRVRAPARVANASRNAGAELDRRRRWAPARDALWDFLAPWLDDGARVAIVGAGNGDDLPLRQIARRAGELVLIDIDPRAVQGARRGLRLSERRRTTVVGHDVTCGAVDRIVLTALRGEATSQLENCVREDPLPSAPYDLVIGDLLYSQLLYPALLDLGVDAERRSDTLARHAPDLTRAVAVRFHASAPRVVHLHDPLAWWDGHEQPVALEEILAAAASDGPDAALWLTACGLGPHESDPRAALADLGISPAATALWRWPFSAGVDYLVCATLART
jgi:hypothetical protein